MAVRQGPTYVLMPTEPALTPPEPPPADRASSYSTATADFYTTSSPPSSSDDEGETEEDPLAEPLPFVCPTPFCEDRVFWLDGRLRCRTCRTQGLHL